MFAQFFFLLRAHKVPVSLTEWLTLSEALARGLALSSLSAFYSLARSILVKSEAYFDQYDLAFQEAFAGVETPEEIADEVWDWLREGAEIPGLSAAERAALAAGLGALDLEELQRLFLERMSEQHEAHHGGSHWIGTGGTSPFGHSGVHQGGIRIGGESRGSTAVKVAAERRYKGYRTDATVGVRQFETALRRLRQLSTRNDGPLDELDLEATIDATADHAGALHLEWRRPRRNQTRVLLLMDAGGSMHAHISACNRLFTAVDRATHLKDLRRYYFHNCVYDQLYLDPTCHPRNSLPTARVLQELARDYKLVVVGDACMAPSELLEPNGIIWWSATNEEPGIDWLHRLARHFHRSVWLNPVHERSWSTIYGRDTIALVRTVFPMFELTVDGLAAAVRSLMVRR
ncbi:MAG: vWA domain-containing protein [Thermoleophilia bacterium]